MHQRIRVGGDVAAGTIQHLPGRVDFVLKAEGKTLPVSYVGADPLPDTFKDGAQCLVEGKAMPDGRFVAEQIQAKCASKYEAAPGGTIIPARRSPVPAKTTRADRTQGERRWTCLDRTPYCSRFFAVYMPSGQASPQSSLASL